MTGKDITHLRKLCKLSYLLLEHFGHRNYDDITVKERIKMPKSVSYTNIDTEHNIFKSSFKKMEKSKETKEEEENEENSEKSSSWVFGGSMKNAVGYGDDNDDDDDDDGEGEGEDDNNNGNGNPTYSINGEKVLRLTMKLGNKHLKPLGLIQKRKRKNIIHHLKLLNLNIMISILVSVCQKEKQC